MTVYYDISLPISPDTPVFPGDPPVEITPVFLMANGDAANVSELRVGSHAGTHIDPPSHMIEGGTTVDRIPPDILIGGCFVCDISDAESINAGELCAAGIPQGTERLLLKTRNSVSWGDREAGQNYSYVTADGADWLVSQGVRLVGIDYLTIEDPSAEDLPVHTSLLMAGIIVVEGLDLRAVREGVYTLVCLPLRIQNGDGSPARAVLIEQTG